MEGGSVCLHISRRSRGRVERHLSSITIRFGHYRDLTVRHHDNDFRAHPRAVMGRASARTSRSDAAVVR